MPINHIKSINLLPQNEFEASSWGRILKWALSSFRIMVIITELIVMAGFLSRFWLDSRNSDLNEELKYNTAQVLAYQEVEDRLKQNQAGLAKIKEYLNKANYSQILKAIAGSLPSDANIISIQTEIDKKFVIVGQAYSEKSIAQFMVNLKQTSIFNPLTIIAIDSNTQNGNLIIFTINATLVEKEVKEHANEMEK